MADAFSVATGPTAVVELRSRGGNWGGCGSRGLAEAREGRETMVRQTSRASWKCMVGGFLRVELGNSQSGLVIVRE